MLDPCWGCVRAVLEVGVLTFLVFVIGFLFALTLRAVGAVTVVRDMQKILWPVLVVSALVLSWTQKAWGSFAGCLFMCLIPLQRWGVERCCLCAIFALVWITHYRSGLVSALVLYGCFCLHYGYRGKTLYSKETLTHILSGCTLYASAIVAAAFFGRAFDMRVVMTSLWMEPVMCMAVFVWAGVYPLPILLGGARQIFKPDSLGYWLGGGMLLSSCLFCPHAFTVFTVINSVLLCGACVLVLRSSYDVWAHMLTVTWIWFVYSFVLMGELQISSIPFIPGLCVFSVVFFVRMTPMVKRLPALWTFLWGASIAHPLFFAFIFWGPLSLSARCLAVANMLLTVFLGSTCWMTQHFSLKKILAECWRVLVLYHTLCVVIYYALLRVLMCR